MARRRGAMVGFLLMILGAWGALIPFIGHSFGYGFTPDNTWTWTSARGWLEVAPGCAAFVGGFLLMTSGNRLSAMVGGWLAAAAGAWFVLGTVVAPWWSAGSIGSATGGTSLAVWERLGMFYGLGVVIVLLAGIGLGRSSVIGVRDVEAARARDIDLTDDEPTRTTTTTAGTRRAPAYADDGSGRTTRTTTT